MIRHPISAKLVSLYAVGAALLMPILVALIGRHLNEILILTLWPASILLLSLGAEPTSISQTATVWLIAIVLNVFLYVTLGLMVFAAVKYLRSQVD